MKQSEFITEHCSDAPSVAKAVIRQIGGWESFKESATDIANHGIDGGFHGFIYHSDTTAFANRNRAAIARLADELADSMGEDAVQMVKGFQCTGLVCG